MARQRFIHPDIWTDPTLGKLSHDERLLFIGCFSNADDEGRLLGSAAYLRSTIFPYDDVTLSEVESMRDHITATCSNLVHYVVDDIEYLAFLKWDVYQKPKYPKQSKFPAPEHANNGEAFPQDLPKPSAETEKASVPRLGLGLDRVGFGSGLCATGEDPKADDDDINLCTKWERAINGIVPPGLHQKFESYTADGMDRAVIAWAIDQAIGADKPQHYVVSVLNDLMSAEPPILTMAALRQRERQRKLRGSPKEKPRNRGQTYASSELTPEQAADYEAVVNR